MSITGLGSSAFGNIVPTIVQIFSMFLPLFPRDTLDLWEADDAKGYEAISTHTRLFTSRSQASDAEPIPFDPLVDSNHNLTRLGKLASGKFIHTSDNEVEYLGPINGAGGNRSALLLNLLPVNNLEVYGQDGECFSRSVSHRRYHRAFGFLCRLALGSGQVPYGYSTQVYSIT